MRCVPQRNMEHAIANDLKNDYGEKSRNAKLTNAQAERIRERYYAGGITQLELAIDFGVSHQTALTLRELGMILAGTGSANLEEVSRNGSVHVLGNSVAEGFILDACDFVSKHRYQFLSLGLSFALSLYLLYHGENRLSS